MDNGAVSQVQQVIHKPAGAVACALFYLSFISFFSNAADNSIRVYQYTAANGIVVYADRAPLQQPYQLLKFDCCRNNDLT